MNWSNGNWMVARWQNLELFGNETHNWNILGQATFHTAMVMTAVR